MLSVIRDGRHRYFRLASPKVVDMLDGIVAVALEARPRYRPLSRQARELSAARIGYDHLALRLSVDEQGVAPEQPTRTSTGDAYHAVSNEAQGVGRLVNTLAPQTQRSEQVDRSKRTIIVA